MPKRFFPAFLLVSFRSCELGTASPSRIDISANLKALEPAWVPAVPPLTNFDTCSALALPSAYALTWVALCRESAGHAQRCQGVPFRVGAEDASGVHDGFDTLRLRICKPTEKHESTFEVVSNSEQCLGRDELG